MPNDRPAGLPSGAGHPDHFKATHWQQGMLVIGLLLHASATLPPANQRGPMGPPGCGMKEALMSQPPRGRVT